MAGKKQLPPVRLATDSDKPVPPKSLSKAFETNDRLEELRAKRRILIAHIEHPNTLARDLAALMRRDEEVAKQIDEELAIIAESEGEADSEVSKLDAEEQRFNPYTA